MTILTINVSLSILLAVLLPLLNRRIFLRNLRGRLLALCCIAIMIRALIPLEFPFSQTIRVSRGLPSIRDMLKYPLAIGNFSVKISWFLFFLWVFAALILISKNFCSISGCRRRSDGFLIAGRKRLQISCGNCIKNIRPQDI